MKLLCTFGIVFPLMAPPDAGAGGGGAAAGDAGAGDGGDGGDAGDGGDGGDGGDAGDGGGDAGRRAGAADDADPDDDGLATEVANDPKRLRTRLRRTQRQLQPFRDLEGQLRDQTTGRLLSPQEITRRFSLAQDQEELNGFFAEHPDMLQQILERRRTGGRREAAVEEFVDPYADAAAIGIDVEDPAGKWVVEQLRSAAKREFELRKEIRDIKAGLTGVQQTTQRERLGRVEQQWRDTTLASAKSAGLVGEDLQDFVNAVYRDFQLAGATKKLDRANVREVIDRNLRPFRRAAAGRTRGAAATQQQQARTNGGKPQPHRQGAPTTAQARTTGKETLKDARTSFFQRAGQQQPAR